MCNYVLCLKGCNQTLLNFTYSDNFMGSVIMQALDQLNFVGIQGKTILDNNGDPLTPMQVQQQQGKDLFLL